MAKCELEILAPAWRELEEIASYHLLMVGPNSARKITDNILDCLERLKDFPLSCPYIPNEELKSDGYRMLVCGKYVCVYRLIGEIIYIYHISNGAMEYSKIFL